jgi:predicted DCC family thiol-disulfide oxidoreductase YuxK
MMLNTFKRGTPPASFNKAIVLYEGNCIPCERIIRFLKKHDKTGSIIYFDYNTAIGERYKESLSREELNADSIILLFNGRSAVRSEAIIKLSDYLGFPWNLLRAAKILPLTARERLFVKATRYRHLFFKIQPTCQFSSSRNAMNAG